MQYPLQIILARQWSDFLEFPVWVFSTDGNLIFYNESAEKLLGLRYEVSGEVKAKEIHEIFKMTDEMRKPLSFDSLPVNIAIKERRPIHDKFWVISVDGSWKFVETTAFPFTCEDGSLLGGISIFWEIKDS